MRVTFWGTRGSLPTPLRADAVYEKIVGALLAANGTTFETAEAAGKFVEKELLFPARGTYGGATSCVEIALESDQYLVCDMGSGLREFAIDSMRRSAEGHPKVYNFLMSHLHWDHIMGFPFFAPAFDPEVTVRVFGGHLELEQALRRQQEKISFPVPFDWLKARFEFNTLTPGNRTEIAGARVELIEQEHDNKSFGYRVTMGGKSVVYCTDLEHKLERMSQEEDHVAFLQDADLVIFDTMYSLSDAITIKQDWGHSSNVVAVDLCHRAGVDCLVMYHHEPAHNDETIHRIHQETIRYEELTRASKPLKVLCAYDGLQVSV